MKLIVSHASFLKGFDIFMLYSFLSIPAPPNPPPPPPIQTNQTILY